jgi:heme exporter protein B
VGKAISSLLFLLVTEAIVLPLVGVLFHLDLAPIALPLALVMLLGTAGYAMAGTVFGAMTVRTSARDFKFSVVLYPLIAPALLGGVVATRELFGGATLAEVADWLKLLFVMDVLMLVGSLWVFDPLMQD